jgi:hypothetical protein
MIFCKMKNQTSTQNKVNKQKLKSALGGSGVIPSSEATAITSKGAN